MEMFGSLTMHTIQETVVEVQCIWLLLQHRYWPGLLLVLRFVLLEFAMNPQQDPNINLLVILVGTGILQMWAWVSGGVYKNWCL